MNDQRKYSLIGVTLILVFIVGLFSTKYIVDQRNIERITYKNGDYKAGYHKLRDEDAPPFDVKWLPAGFKPTGIKVKGMEVYDDTNPQTSMRIYLKTKSGKFLSYAKLGGP